MNLWLMNWMLSGVLCVVVFVGRYIVGLLLMLNGVVGIVSLVVSFGFCLSLCMVFSVGEVILVLGISRMFMLWNM